MASGVEEINLHWILFYVPGNCTSIIECEDCLLASCSWIQCYNFEPGCEDSGPSEGCIEISCMCSVL